MNENSVTVEFPALLQVDISASPEASSGAFSDELIQKIQEAVETAVFSLDIPAEKVEGRNIKIDGALVLPWRVGDHFTAFDTLLGQMNHLVRLVCHAETDEDWMGRVQQTMPPEVFEKLVEHIGNAISTLKQLGVPADQNQWPELGPTHE